MNNEYKSIVDEFQIKLKKLQEDSKTDSDHPELLSKHQKTCLFDKWQKIGKLLMDFEDIDNEPEMTGLEQAAKIGKFLKRKQEKEH
ncbi:MAG: hypothetical protein D4R63_08050 [Methylococcaceae bacterium]|nr:MAG: hypothetical protein D4R63_08050 [Methylococcaceae bacterium]